MNSISEHHRMMDEWLAWQGVVGELLALDVDPNSETPLVNAIRAWGEYLVTLRDSQSRDIVDRAFEEIVGESLRTMSDSAREYVNKVGR